MVTETAFVPVCSFHSIGSFGRLKLSSASSMDGIVLEQEIALIDDFVAFLPSGDKCKDASDAEVTFMQDHVPFLEYNAMLGLRRLGF